MLAAAQMLWLALAAQPGDPDPCTWSMVQRRAVRDRALRSSGRWGDIVRAHSCIADDAERDALYEETDWALWWRFWWPPSKRAFHLTSRWARRGAGSDSRAVSAVLGLSRHLVAYQPSWQHERVLYDVLQSPHAQSLQGISYTPHSRGDEMTARLLKWFAAAELQNLRYFNFRGGDLSREEDFVAFLQSPSAAKLSVAYFGGSEQRLWFKPLQAAPMLPGLEALLVRVGPSQQADAQAFFETAPMGRLESLTVHDPGIGRRDHEIARAIGANPHLAGLRVLRLTAHSRFEDPDLLVDALLQAPYLQQLALLCVSVSDAHQLQRLQRADKFQHTKVQVSPRCSDDPFLW